MEQSPQPARHRTHVALLKIPLDKLKDKSPSFNEIAREMSSRNAFRQAGMVTVKRVDLQAWRVILSQFRFGFDLALAVGESNSLGKFQTPEIEKGIEARLFHCRPG